MNIYQKIQKCITLANPVPKDSKGYLITENVFQEASRLLKEVELSVVPINWKTFENEKNTIQGEFRVIEANDNVGFTLKAIGKGSDLVKAQNEARKEAFISLFLLVAESEAPLQDEKEKAEEIKVYLEAATLEDLSDIFQMIKQLQNKELYSTLGKLYSKKKTELEKAKNEQ